MSCSIEDIKGGVMANLETALTSSHKGYKKVSPGVYDLYRHSKLSINKVFDAVNEGRNNVTKFVTDEYGAKYTQHWTKIDRTHPNRIRVTMMFPSVVENLIRAKMGLISLEEANDVKHYEKDAREASYDPILEEQEKRSDNLIDNFEDIEPVVSKENYTAKNEFPYDKSRETDIEINEAQLQWLMKNEKKC